MSTLSFFTDTGSSSGAEGPRIRTAQDLLLDCLEDITGREFKRFKDKLSDFSFGEKRPIPYADLEHADPVDTTHLLINYYEQKGALEVTIKVFKAIGLMGPAESLEEERKQMYCRGVYMNRVKEKYRLLIKKHLNEEERGHELIATGRRHVQIMPKRSTQEYSPTTIQALFDPDEHGIIPRTVVLVGPAGIGKTLTSQKIMLDWASGDLYQDRFSYVFYISCREINNITGEISIARFLSEKCQPTCPLNQIQCILRDPRKLLFIIDGLNELKWTYNKQSEVCKDPFQETRKEIILNSLFTKQTIEEASLIITTRPFTLEKMRDYVQKPRNVEILGFTEEDREQFFYHFFEIKEQAEIALNVVKDNETLFTMCSVPVICRIVCSLMKQEMGKSLNEINSKTSTSVYMLYLKSLLNYHSPGPSRSVKTSLMKLCALAKEGIWDRKILFEERDLSKHGLSVSDIKSLFLNENIFVKDTETYTRYSFIHLSVQEFLAALYYVLSEGTKFCHVLENFRNWRDVQTLLEKCDSGHQHLTLTVRFLFGLCSEQQINTTKSLFGCEVRQITKYALEQWLKENKSFTFEERLNCLYETQDEEFVRRMMSHFLRLRIIGSSVSPTALSYCLMNSTSPHTIDFYDYRMDPKSQDIIFPALHRCTNLRRVGILSSSVAPFDPALESRACVLSSGSVATAFESGKCVLSRGSIATALGSGTSISPFVSIALPLGSGTAVLPSNSDAPALDRGNSVLSSGSVAPALGSETSVLPSRSVAPTLESGATILSSGSFAPSLVSGIALLTSPCDPHVLVSGTKVLTSGNVAPNLVSALLTCPFDTLGWVNGTEILTSPSVAPALGNGTKILSSDAATPCLVRGTEILTNYSVALALESGTNVLSRGSVILDASLLVVGFPQEIISDQGTQFMVDVVHHLWRIYGIKPSQSSPFHLKQNGLCKWFNGTLKQMFQRFTTASRDWERFLPHLLFPYREVPQESTGLSPFELLYGRRVRGSLELIREHWEGGTEKEGMPVLPYVLELRGRLEYLTAYVEQDEDVVAICSPASEDYDNLPLPDMLQGGSQTGSIDKSSPKERSARYSQETALSRESRNPISGSTCHPDGPGPGTVYVLPKRLITAHLSLLAMFPGALIQLVGGFATSTWPDIHLPIVFFSSLCRLEWCGLTSANYEGLRPVIITNRSLTRLDLSHTDLQDSGVKLLCDGLRHPDCTLQDLRLERCGLTSDICEDLRSVIITNRSLTRLDLLDNNLQDSGVKLLCDGLRHPDCTLQDLGLQCCDLTSAICEDLRSVIITNRSLTKLDLSGGNILQNSGVKLLCDGLRHPDCTLQELWLFYCNLSSDSCDELRSVIITNRSLTRLDLSYNFNLQESGVKHLCDGLRHPDCTLQDLGLERCGLTSAICEDLHSVIITNRSLTRLDLSYNRNLQDSGVKRLCDGLRHPDCTLQDLRLWDCGLTSDICDDLRSVIITNRSLTRLDLSYNKLQDSGVKLLCDGLRHPDCNLQDLRLQCCGQTSDIREDLRSVIITNRSLTRLELNQNNLQDSGVKRLCDGLRHPDCTLQELGLEDCGLTSATCDDLRSVIITNRSLTKLHLSGNDLQDSGVRLLCDGLRHPDCTLQDLRLLKCGLTSPICEDLRSVIIRNRSLTRLDLSYNNGLQDSGVRRLCDGLRHPDCTLQKLRLRDCGLTSDICEDLHSVILS
ncbi:NACHT, LRR and PYD domains-containing protein 12-like [Rhinophrynus dorsalis]